MKTIFVTDAQYHKKYKLKIRFNDGTEKIVDFEPQIRKIRVPVYKKYQEIENFKQFKIENGNIVWGENWDLIFPVHQLYEGKIL